jgi:apolipoprotein N-acyltransferase
MLAPVHPALENKKFAAASPSWMVCLGLFLLGTVATLGWSPLEQIWIAWLAFTALVVKISKAHGPVQALTQCFCFALGLHTAGHGWVFSALYEQTNAGLLWSLMGSLLFLSYLSAFLAIPAAIGKWLCVRLEARAANTVNPRASILLGTTTLAVAWTGADAARGMLFNGFDSIAAGYLFSAWPLRGWVPVLGVYGSGLLFYASTSMAGAAWAARHRSARVPATGSALSLALVLVLVTVGGAALDTKKWVQPIGSPLSFRLLQGGIPQKMKFDAHERERHAAAYFDAITAAPADLIVTPETAFTVGLTELNPGSLSKMRNFSTATDSNLFLGTPHLDGHGGIRNSMFHIVPGSSELPRYDKARLMPFGEYAPAGFGWLTQSMSVALNDQTAGSFEQPPFQARARNTIVNVGTMICHEDLSTSDARQKAPSAHLFINPGNLAWFAGTHALPQRLQVAQVRALETGRPVLRITNTGVTAHIDEKGRVLSRLPEDQAAVLHGLVQPTTGLTPFVRFGHWYAVGLAMVLLAIVALLQLRQKQL